MNRIVEKYLNWDYLYGVSENVWFQEYLLYVAIFVILVPVIVAIFFKLRKRSKAYKNFDKKFFWGFLILGLLGLFVWFSVSQSLTTLGSRITVFLWLSSIAIYKTYLYIYFRKVTVKEVTNFHEKKRKDKYLKR